MDRPALPIFRKVDGKLVRIPKQDPSRLYSHVNKLGEGEYLVELRTKNKSNVKMRRQNGKPAATIAN
jgi:hypothetical protein